MISKLNHSKCVCGATSDKLMGFIVSQHGIEIDPTKIKAITENAGSKNGKGSQGFLGRLNYIGRFIVQLTTTCEPLFKLLRKNKSSVWNEDCRRAFEKIKPIC